MANEFMRTSSEVSAIVPQQWSQKYYDLLLKELVFESMISRDYEGEIGAYGDTVKIPTIPEFDDATLLAEDAAADADSVTVSTQNLVINKRIVKDFIVTNKASLQSIPFVEKLKELAAYAIKKKIEAEIIAAIVPSAAPDHTIAAASPGVMALADMLAAKELMDAQSIPMSGRHMVMGAGPLNDIFNIVEFKSTEYITSGQPMASGALPSQMLGFMPHFTAGLSNVVYFFHESFMTIAAQQGLEVKEYDMGVDGYRAKRVNCDTLIGLKQLDDKRVVALTV